MAIMTANMAFPRGLRRPSNIIAFLNWQRVKLGTEKDCRTSFSAVKNRSYTMTT